MRTTDSEEPTARGTGRHLRRIGRVPAGIVAVALAAGGCAGTTFRDVTDNPTANGIRYCPPATYVLVKPDYEAKTAHVEVFQAPDTSRTFAADPYAYLADNTTELTFADGLLAKVDSQSDSTAIAKTTVAALTEIGKALLDTAVKAAKAAALAGGRPAGGSKVATDAVPVTLFKVSDEPTGASSLVKLFPKP